MWSQKRADCSPSWFRLQSATRSARHGIAAPCLAGTEAPGVSLDCLVSVLEEHAVPFGTQLGEDVGRRELTGLEREPCREPAHRAGTERLSEAADEGRRRRRLDRGTLAPLDRCTGRLPQQIDVHLRRNRQRPAE